MKRIILGVSGASGSILAFKLLKEFTAKKIQVVLVMTKEAALTSSLELGKGWNNPAAFVSHLDIKLQKFVEIQSNQFLGASVASGTALIDAMLVVPCSMATLAAIAAGLSDNLLRRAADVTIKERRPLILMPREMPFSPIHLENMLKLSRLGVHMMPPVPAWYLKQSSIAEVEDYCIGKILDILRIEHSLYERWS
jgi:flavin prenyltransferase